MVILVVKGKLPMSDIEVLKEEIIITGKRVYDKEFVASNDGNLSIRLSDERILITPSGISKGFMKTEDLIIIDMTGKVISGNRKPSSEYLMHIEIYRARHDVNAICHAHPPYATAFAVCGIPLDEPVLPEVIITLGSIPLIEYGTPGTEDLYKPLIKKIHQYDAFLLENHGVVTIGKDIQNAYNRMETVEHFAKIMRIARQIGSVKCLSAEEVIKLKSQREKFGIRTDLGN